MELAELAISVDSRDVKTAEAELKRLTETGARTERAMDGVGAGGKEAARGSDAAAKSSRDAQQAMERQRDAAQRLTATVRYFAVAAAAAGAASVAWIMRMSDSIDSTAKMAEQIGVTTEALTGMRFAAQQFANISDQQFDMSMRRMTRRIAEAAQGTGSAKGALEELGLSAQQLARMTPDQQMLELADAMARTEHQADRLRYTMALFDTEGMALVPALQQGSRALEENIRLAERYGVVISTEAAQAAASFRTEVDRLKAIVWGFSVDMANQVLPTLSEFIRYAIEAATEVDGVHSEVKDLANDDSFKNWFDAALVGLARVGDVAVFVAKAIGTVGLAFQAAAADVKGALALIGRPTAADRLLMPEEQYSRLMAEYEAIRKQQVSTTERFNQMLSDLINKPLNMLEQAALRAVNTVRVTGDAYEVFTVDLTSTGEAAGATAEQMQNLESWMARLATPAEQLEAALAKAREELGPLFTPEIEQRIRAQYAAQKMGATVMSDAARAAEEFARAREQALYAQYTSISAIHEEAEALELQNEVFGLSRDAIERLHIARLEEQAAILRGFGGSEQQIALIEAEIEARKRLRDAMGERESLEARLQARTEEQRARDEYLREWERTNEMVGQSLTDALLRGFEDGRGFAENFAKTLKSMFASLVLRPIIQPVAQGAAGMVTNALGLSQPGGIGSMLSAGQGISGIWSALSGGLVSSVGSGIASLGSALGSSALQTFAAGMKGSTLAAGLAGPTTAGAGGLMGAGAMVGSALPWVAGGLAAYNLISGFFNEPEARYGGTYQHIPGVGTERPGWERGDPGPQAMAFADNLLSSAAEAIEKAFAGVGSDAFVRAIEASFESSEKGRGGTHSGGILVIDGHEIRFGTSAKGQGHGGTDGTLEEMMRNAEIDVYQTVIQAWQKGLDQFPAAMQDMIRDIDADALGLEQAQALVQQFVETIEQVNALTEALRNLPFAPVTAATFDYAAALAQAAGGVNEVTQLLGSYFENYYTEAERAAALTKQLTREFAELGFELPKTRDELRGLIEAQFALGEAGIETLVALLRLESSFASLTEAAAGFDGQLSNVRDLAQEATRLLGARNRAGTVLDQIDRAMGRAGAFGPQREAELWSAMSTASYEQQIDLARELTDIVLNRYQDEIAAAETLRDLGRSLRDYVQSLMVGDLSPLTLGERLATAGAEYASLLARAQAGDEGAMQDLQGAADAYLQLARDYYASSDEYTRIFGYITGSLDALGIQAETEAQRQLSVSESSLSELSDIRGVTEQAYTALDQQLNVARQQLQSETALLASIGADTGRLHDIASLLSGLPAELAARLQPLLGGAAAGVVGGWYDGAGFTDAAGVDYWAGQLQQRPAEQVQQDYLNTLVADWYRDHLGWAPDQAGLQYWVGQARELGAQSAFEDFMRTANPHRDGLGFVPYDDYPALLHRGERVLTARENVDFTRYMGGGNEALVAEIRRLNDRIAKLESTINRNGDKISGTVAASSQANAREVATAVTESASRTEWDSRNRRLGDPR